MKLKGARARTTQTDTDGQKLILGRIIFHLFFILMMTIRFKLNDEKGEEKSETK